MRIQDCYQIFALSLIVIGMIVRIYSRWRAIQLRKQLNDIHNDKTARFWAEHDRRMAIMKSGGQYGPPLKYADFQ